MRVTNGRLGGVTVHGDIATAFAHCDAAASRSITAPSPGPEKSIQAFQRDFALDHLNDHDLVHDVLEGLPRCRRGDGSGGDEPLRTSSTEDFRRHDDRSRREDCVAHKKSRSRTPFVRPSRAAQMSCFLDQLRMHALRIARLALGPCLRSPSLEIHSSVFANRSQVGAISTERSREQYMERRAERLGHFGPHNDASSRDRDDAGRLHARPNKDLGELAARLASILEPPGVDGQDGNGT